MGNQPETSAAITVLVMGHQSLMIANTYMHRNTGTTASSQVIPAEDEELKNA